MGRSETKLNVGLGRGYYRSTQRLYADDRWALKTKELVQMKHKENYVLKARKLSGYIFYIVIGLFLLNILFYSAVSHLTTPIILYWMDLCIYILACFVFITPGIAILFAPWLAHAWLSGINWMIPRKPWEELSALQKVLIYLTCMVFLLVGAAIGYGVITGNFPIR